MLTETAGLQLLSLAAAAATVAVTWAVVPYYDDLTTPPVVPWTLLVPATVIALVLPQAVALCATRRGLRARD